MHPLNFLGVLGVVFYVHSLYEIDLRGLSSTLIITVLFLLFLACDSFIAWQLFVVTRPLSKDGGNGGRPWSLGSLVTHSAE